MAVQAQHLRHGLHAYNNFRAPDDEMTGGSLYLDTQAGRAPAMAGTGNTVFGDVPPIDLTWYDNTSSQYGFVQRKRARVAAEAPSFLENQRAQGLVPVVGDVLSPCRAVGSGAASTSGRRTAKPNAAGLPRDIVSHLYHQGMEIDALVRVEVRTSRINNPVHGRTTFFLGD